MKIVRLVRAAWFAAPTAAVLFLVGSRGEALAQFPGDSIPVVSIRATDPRASLAGDTATFTVFREGNTNMSVNLFYRIGGTASNGVDYATIPNRISIPAGAYTNSVLIQPIDHGQTDLVQTVILHLAYPPTEEPINYIIGDPDTAEAYITATTFTNKPPLVKITLPEDGATFWAPADVTIAAEAQTADTNGYVATVQFFANGTSLGIKTNNPASASPVNPFMLTWTNVPAGNYSLTALATDNSGAYALSQPVKITVLQPKPPPPTNAPPAVRINSPTNGQTFFASVVCPPCVTDTPPCELPCRLAGPDIPVYATASASSGLASVEFFADGQDLGPGTLEFCFTPEGTCAGCPPPVLTCAYSLVWSNAPVGNHVLAAIATDNSGLSNISAPVSITVLSLPPPPTNRPAVVSIVATDPVAIEGTNCWRWLGVTNSTPTWDNWRGAFLRFFTNCGPKNATFVVRRLGSTNDDLTVLYNIGGTATNGVDYVALPGSIVIPAASRSAMISIVPIDNDPPDLNSTVVLSLAPSTNYVAGIPRRAAALIVDSNSPPPPFGFIGHHSFHFSEPGPDGAWFHVEYSTNLHDWTSICTNQVVNGSIDFTDPDASADPARFYRVVPNAGPPGE